MKVDATQGDLAAAMQEFNEFKRAFPYVSTMIMGSKLKDFNRENGIRINVMNEKIERLKSRLIKHDEKGKPIVIELPDGTTDWDFNDEESKSEYNEAIKKIYEQPCTITF